MTSQEHITTAYVTLEDKMTELAIFNATMAIAVGQREFIAAIEAMRNQGPPEVGGTRMMTCGNTIGSNACKGNVSEQIYIVTHQDSGNSVFRYKCLNCNTGTDVKRVATASLPLELQPAPKAAATS